LNLQGVTETQDARNLPGKHLYTSKKLPDISAGPLGDARAYLGRQNPRSSGGRRKEDFHRCSRPGRLCETGQGDLLLMEPYRIA